MAVRYRRTHARSWWIAALSLAISLTAVPVSPSDAGGQEPLTSRLVRSREIPLRSYGDIIVHGPSRRILVSEGAGGRRIAVLNLRGRLIRVLRRKAGPAGMEIHRGKLYVAMTRRPSIVVFNLDGFRRLRSFKVESLTAPGYLAKSAGRLWFGMTTSTDTREYLGGISFRRQRLRTYGRMGRFRYVWEPGFASSPGLPGRLFAWSDPGSTPTDAVMIDVRGWPQRIAAASPLGEGDGGGTVDAVITPNGNRVLTASSATYAIESFDVTDLTRRFRYADTAYVAAVDVSSSGRWVAGVNRGLASSVFLFRAGRRDPVAVHTFRRGLAFRKGLAFVPDKRRVVVVTGNDNERVWVKVVAFPRS